MRALLLLLAFFVFESVFAANQDKQLRVVQEKIKSVTQDLSQLKRQQGRADANLKRVERQYGDISRAVRSVTGKVKGKQARLNEIDQEMQVQHNWLGAQKKQLAGLVRSAYALGGQEQLKLFFNQQDGARYSRVMQYYRYFNQARVNSLEQVNASLQLLSVLQQEKQQEIQALQQLVAENKQKKDALAATKQERKQVLAKIKKEVRHSSSTLSKLKKNERQLKRLLRSLQQQAAKKDNEVFSATAGKPFAQLKGKLNWPVLGKVVRSFGSARAEGRWNGVLLRAKEGNNVRAIAHGQVIFADWFKGYGLLLIVKHDKNYMSLYAFNQSLYKEKGDWVEAGDMIATVGKSDGRKRAGLYFEIRKKNKPVNPARWCKAKR